MIKEINSKEYERFLRGNDANRHQVSINLKGEHYGYYLDDDLVGVISIMDTVNTRRVKGFLVNAKYQNNGIGKELLKHVLVDDKDMTAFATVLSRPLFEKEDFEWLKEHRQEDATVKQKDKFHIFDMIKSRLL